MNMVNISKQNNYPCWPNSWINARYTHSFLKNQGYALYQLIDVALKEHGNLLDESAIYKYKIKYSQNLPVQLQTNLEKINSLPKEKQKEVSYLIYDSINSFSDNSLVVMTEEVKEQYQKFLNENKTQVSAQIQQDSRIVAHTFPHRASCREMGTAWNQLKSRGILAPSSL